MTCSAMAILYVSREFDLPEIRNTYALQETSTNLGEKLLANFRTKAKEMGIEDSGIEMFNQIWANKLGSHFSPLHAVRVEEPEMLEWIQSMGWEILACVSSSSMTKYIFREVVGRG